METKKLRQKILDLAIRGKLVPQDPNDEPASVLLERIRAEKERLIAEGKIKRPKKSKASSSESHYQKLYELPKSWQWCQLGNFTDDLQYGTSEKSVANGEVAVLRMGNITRTGEIDYANLAYTSSEADIEKYSLRKGDLLFNRTNSSDWVGKTAFYDEKVRAIYAGYLIRIRPIHIDSEYLNIFMNSDYYRRWCQSVKTDAVNQSNVNAQKLSHLWCPIPPLEEQKRITERVKDYIAKIVLIEKSSLDILNSIGHAKSKFLELAMQGKLVPQDPTDEPAADMLRRVNPKARIITDNPHYPQLPDNWVLTTIDSVCNYGHCTTVPVENIKNDDWILELEDIEKDSGRVIEKKIKISRNISGVRHQFNEGNVLYSKLRTYLNKVLLATKDGYCSTEIVPISCFSCIQPQYLCHWLRSPYFLNYALSCGYGVKMPRQSTSDAKNGIVPLPPINEQRQIISKLKILFSLLDNLSNHLS